MDLEEYYLMKDVFGRYDVNNKGYLSRREFYKFIVKFMQNRKSDNITLKELESLYAYIDENGKDGVSFQEFRNWWTSANKYDFFTVKRFRELLLKGYQLYRKYTEGDNMHYHEFNTMMDDLDLERDDYSFDILDKNEDGIIAFREFMNWLDWLSLSE